jgi:AraC-like DNA-binding protein
VPRKQSQPAIPPERFTDLRTLPLSVPLDGHVAHMLYWGHFPPKWWRNFLHTHSFYEICYAYAGRGVFRMMGQNLEVKAGDLFIAKPTEPHEIISNRREPLGIYFWAYSLTRDRRQSSHSPVDQLLEAFARSKQWVSGDVPAMHRTLEMLTQEIAARLPGYPAAIEGLLRKLLLDTARAVAGDEIPAERVEPPANSETETIVRTACRYVHDNLARPISVRDIAAQVSVSERHLGRLFQQVEQSTVMDYATNARLAAASQMLLDQFDPVKKIAAAVGYPDVHYFTTLFRKQMGMTPAVFRKRRGTRFVDERNRHKLNGPR